jgi:hypothetical protein
VRWQHGIDLWQEFGRQATRQRLYAVDAQELLTLNPYVVGDERVDGHQEIATSSHREREGALLTIDDPRWLAITVAWQRNL